MSFAKRSTVVVQGRLAMRHQRLALAREGRHGVQVMTFEQLAVRLAGGFTCPIDDESLRAAIQMALPCVGLGELDSIKTLPGMTNAATETLRKAWYAGIEFETRAAEHPRLDAIARLEAAVLDQLPAAVLRPLDIAAAAQNRIAHAAVVLGEVLIERLSDLPPCWRPLLIALAQNVSVQWNFGPRPVPDWLDGSAVSVQQAPAQTPAICAVSAATTYHESIEAMRWVRKLLVSGVPPSEIAIAASSTTEYDEHFLALRADANLDLHFVHGIKTVSTREGQAAAALADIVVYGLSQSRVRRLASLCRDSAAWESLPKGWQRILPNDAPLLKVKSWEQLFSRLEASSWVDGQDHTPTLRTSIELLSQGPEAATQLGKMFLKGRALTIWNKALQAGPAVSIDQTLETLKQDDGLDACISIAWMPANTLAASPRRYVRLIGLNASQWPRAVDEDRLIPTHVIPTSLLDPLSLNLADRRDFEIILASTDGEVVLSRARRDKDGRLLGRSPLLGSQPEEAYLRRHAVPEHAYSETDRIMARPNELQAQPQALSAQRCWNNWRSTAITAHDGLVRAKHPLIDAILDRTQSASSLRHLLRNPIGFVWAYGLGWRAPQSASEPLVLDGAQNGNLVHEILEKALLIIEKSDGLANAPETLIETAVATAVADVAAQWETEHPVPPRIIWERTLEAARTMANWALSEREGVPSDSRAYAEVPFGGSSSEPSVTVPWNTAESVPIPGTGFNITGYIDRLDLSADGAKAFVRDYKTGRKPKDEIELDGGRELQRCLYSFAVKALLGDQVAVSASLLYPRDKTSLHLADSQDVMNRLTDYLQAARTSLVSGVGVPGTDAGINYDELAFALPANASATYCKRKLPAATEALGEAANIWEEK
ncbi:PD-(D/E)XK nuclease superfamily protein [compost metagenome]